MAGSSSSSFSWTFNKIGAALNTSLQVVRGGKDDPFIGKNLRKIVSKLNASLPFSIGKELTTDALRELLYEYRARHTRICEISDLPYGKFSTSKYKIVMNTEDYEKHVKVCRHSVYAVLVRYAWKKLNFCNGLLLQAYPDDAEFINKDIPFLAEMTILFGLGTLPGWRKRRRPVEKRTRVIAEGDDDDDDFMPMPPPRPALSPEKSQDKFSNDPLFTPEPPLPKIQAYKMPIDFPAAARSPWNPFRM